ncbi:hypothetical protein [Olleya sp. Bg11-27]|uniref:hypothetical protein n=1 Tax=Olleya sp. Bg11-27 TaxID=2058135 RepID=UPI0012FDFCAE|nr:hypothetical protein [Olleya sp. Bg11-27]
MEIFLRNIPNDYLFKKKYLDEHSSEIETLILGSSHSLYGFNPEYFTSKTFNASYISQTLNFDYEIFHKYKFKNLKTIVLPISYFSLWENLRNGPESWRVKNYILYLDLHSKLIIDHSEILSNRLNINLERLVLFYIFGKQNIISSKLGWGTNFKSEYAHDLIQTGKNRAYANTYDINSDEFQNIFNDNKLILNLFINECKDRNIRLLLLNPPAFKTFRNNLNANQLKITIETSEEFASEYDNCLYLNLIDDSNFIAEDFYDADHLSEIGAEKLSKLINKKINNWK